MNAAGEMRPSDATASRVHTFLVHVLSGMATAVSFVWVAAALEVVSRVVPTPDAVKGLSGSCAVGLAAFLLILVLVFRASRSGRPHVGVTAGHSAAVLIACLVALAFQPSQLAVEIDNVLFRGLAVDSYTSADFARIPAAYASQGSTDVVFMTQYIDPLAWVGYVSLAVVGVLLLAGLAAEKAPSMQCALVACAIAVALVNLYGAILLALAKSFTSAVTGHSTIQRLLPTDPRLDDAVLIGRTGNSFSTHVLPLVALLTALITVLAVTLIAARLPLASLRGPDRRESLNRWAHVALPQTGKRLRTAMWAASLLILLLIEFLGLGIGVLASRWGGYETVNNVQSFAPGRPATLLLTGSGLVLGAALFALRNASLRARLAQSLAFVGDVIGFWPVHTHPFAAQSYRPAATRAIAEALPDPPAAPTVLVGHSQGSVLTAWYVAHAPTPRPDLALITCGSPLESLYTQFFPTHFDHAFFQKVIGNSRYWINIWRETDPIATSISAADSNRQSTDPAPGEALRCHSHYWIDAAQERAVLETLGLHGGPPLFRTPTVQAR
ncbi:MAG: hypothetical protein ABI662_09370 [Dermatophilaceae bacterium]